MSDINLEWAKIRSDLESDIESFMTKVSNLGVLDDAGLVFRLLDHNGEMSLIGAEASSLISTLGARIEEGNWKGFIPMNEVTMGHLAPPCSVKRFDPVTGENCK